MGRMRWPLWMRSFLKNRTSLDLDDNTAKWKQKLSIAYAIIAWNAFGFVCYAMYKGEAKKNYDDEGLTPAQQITKRLRIKDATAYTVSGFKVHKYEIHNNFDDEE